MRVLGLALAACLTAASAQAAEIRVISPGVISNSGLTEVIDPLGRVTASLPPEQIGLLDVVPANRLPDTVFTRFGYWPLLVTVLLGLAIALWSARGRRKG